MASVSHDQRLLRTIGTIALLACCLTSFAQITEEAQIVGQPLMYMKSGEVDGCGIRFLGANVGPVGKGGTGFDGSINIYAQGIAAAKVLSYDFSSAPSGAKPTRVPVDSFWMKAPGANATHPKDGQYHPGEDAGSRIYVTNLDSALELLTATIGKKNITFGIRRSSESFERLYFGTVTMTQAEGAQVTRCLDDLIQRMSKEK